MKKLKILHTTTSYVLGGGVENNIFQTISRLRSEYEFHFVCGHEFQVNIFSNFPEVKVLCCRHLTKRINIHHDLMVILYFFRLIRREKYDIVHTHEAKDGLLVRIAAWLAGCPSIIYGLHGVYFNDPMSAQRRRLFLLMERVVMPCADRIISVSHDAIRIFHGHHIGVGLPFDIVRSGVDIPAFLEKGRLGNEEKEQLRKQFDIGANDRVLINIGRFSSSKGQRFTIEAFARLKKHDNRLKLVLVGVGPLLDDCRKLTVAMGLDKDVIFTGFQENIAGLLSLAEVLLLSSLREGLPRVIVEAALMKIPAVSFDVEGVKEIIVDGVSGFIVEKYDISALDEKTRLLLNDEQLRSNFGKRAYDRVVHEWNAELMGKKLRDIYNLLGDLNE